MLERDGPPLDAPPQPQLFHNEQHAEVEPPQQEIPARAVPDAGGAPHHQQIEAQPGPGHPVAPHGDIHVLPEPGPQGYVPAPPELGDGARDIGVVEVPRKLKAQHPAQAHGHVGVAGEIEVDLQGEGDHAQPGARRGELRGGQSLVGVPELPQIVGQQYFLAQTYREGLYAGGKPLHRVVPVVDLISQLLILDDRPGDELGEQGDEGAEIDEIPLDRCVTPVDVDGIGHGLEGVERDADGQAQAQNGHEGQPNGGQAPGDKVPVLEKEKQRQVEYH